MANPTLKLSQHWTDILLPPVPAEINRDLLVASIVLLLLAVMVVAWLWQYRPRQTAKRALRRYRRQLQSHAADTRAIAYATYRAVIDGLSLQHMQCDLHKRESMAWARYFQRLQGCAFSSRAPSHEQVQALIQDGLDWLRHG